VTECSTPIIAMSPFPLAYSLYLTHKALIHLVDAWFPKLQSTGGIPWTIVYALVCVAAAVALHFAIERPFLKLRKRLDWQPRRTTEWPA